MARLMDIAMGTTEAKIINQMNVTRCGRDIACEVAVDMDMVRTDEVEFPDVLERFLEM